LYVLVPRRVRAHLGVGEPHDQVSRLPSWYRTSRARL